VKSILLIAAVLLSSASLQGQASGTKGKFPVFDATGFTSKPDLSTYGIRPIMVVYPNFMWDGNRVPDSTSLPDKTRVIAFAKLASDTTRLLVVDIEHWSLFGDPPSVADSVKKYQTVLGWYKSSAEPEVKIGLYGAAPVRDYWSSVQPKNSARYIGWQKLNDQVAPLAKAEDIVFPSIYTFYDDQTQWQQYAIAHIQEARRISGGKPVYVFFMPEYHGSNPKIGNTFLPGDYWKMELETARKYADGVVIWCCQTKEVWNENAAWWVATKQFLKEVNP
jgi:hypothetical protein